MAQPPIIPLDVAAGDSIYDAEAAINTLIDQSVKNVGMTGGQLVTVETQDGTNIQFRCSTMLLGRSSWRL